MKTEYSRASAAGFRLLRQSIIAFFISTVAYGFGNQGHEVVAIVAWQQLNAADQALIIELARQNPEIYGTRSGVEILKHAAKWPDIIRGLARDDEAENFVDTELSIFTPVGVQTASEADDMHYDNRNKAGVAIDNQGVRASYAITRSFEVLRDSTSSSRSKGEALAYLAHCVGDIHQPLHAGYLKDKGGNNIKGLRVPGRRSTVSLHSLWDTGLFQTTGITNSNTYSNRLLPRVAGLSASAIANLNPNAWSEESFTLALSHAYSDEGGNKIERGSVLTDEYVARALAANDEQLIKAGCRLAALLSKALHREAPGGHALLSLPLPMVGTSSTDWSLHIAILDVGQADAIVMVTPDGSACVIDAGKTSTSGRLVADFLTNPEENMVRRIQTVQLAFATHYDSDHIGGFEAIADAPIVFKNVGDQGRSIKRRGKQVYSSYLHAVGDDEDTGNEGVRVKVDVGDEWQLGGAKIRCLSVRGDTSGTQNDLEDLNPFTEDIDENPGSIALLIRVGEFEFYTAGDQTSDDWKNKPDTEIAVVKSGAFGSSGSDIDVLKVNHHGSDTSTGHDFIRALRPEVAVISSKFTGGDRLPKMVVVKQLVEAGAQVLVTGNGHDPETDTFSDSKHADDDGYVPPVGSVSNACGTVHIFVSTDGSRYSVKADAFTKTYSAVDP